MDGNLRVQCTRAGQGFHVSVIACRHAPSCSSPKVWRLCVCGVFKPVYDEPTLLHRLCHHRTQPVAKGMHPKAASAREGRPAPLREELLCANDAGREGWGGGVG